MNEIQWDTLLKVVQCQPVRPLPAGFIIDSPWLPGWTGMSILDYYVSETRWLEANLQAIKAFPEAMFLPGFWSEYGMCTEPSAFGCKCVWQEHELPHAEKLIDDIEDIDWLQKPDPRKDGLNPFVVRRLQHAMPELEKHGHSVRFAVARGPLNIASFMMGTTEFCMAAKTNPDEVHHVLTVITDYLVDWIQYQAESVSSIRGVLVLDDIVGFFQAEDIEELAVPYLKRCFSAIDSDVRFFHNDAHGLECAPMLHDIGINLFNFSFNHSMQEMREAAGPKVALLGGVPPRDVLALGTPDDVRKSVREVVADAAGMPGVLYSVGGGMSPNTPTANIRAFLEELSTAS